MAKFRYEIVETDNINPYSAPIAVRDVYSIDDPEVIITETREQGKLYYIKKVKNKLILKDADFGHYYSQINSCVKYWVNIYKECTDGETFIYRCFFNQQNVIYDIDKCVCEIELQDSSIYNCINENRNLETNLMEYDSPATPPLPANFKFFVGDPLTYRTVSLFKAVFWTLGQMACCDERPYCFIRAISDFFNWTIDPFDATNIIEPTSQPAANYVNPLQPGYWPYLSQKSDFKDPTATNPATNFPISFDMIEKIMSEVFNVYWVIESDLYLRFEHYSWFSSNINYDAINATNFPLNELKNKIQFDPGDFPKKEVFKWMEQGSTDFAGVPIYYNENCTSNKSNERGAPFATTDINYISNNPDKIDNSGMVILDCYEVGTGILYPYIATGYLTAVAQSNARLGWANLHYDLHRHNRPFKTGVMNNIPETFLSPVYNKIQDNILVENCCADPYEKHDSLVLTEIGAGLIEEAEINFTKEIIRFKLKHE